ncbi:hypothetical protein SRABI83_02214 [Arthrobacter sp. Bi83]|uniref:hypothetical protein n=1 Tax=Arthrobacter sp. Bi83 TaxID=2822353 RepID=UPI001D37B4C0|nr:hypothetical protein [Arthrobacter sp. Bi83]CAH0214018.1 hypothetical protein SRABI83_02214 [Arthrobacter sp. Bi83]
MQRLQLPLSLISTMRPAREHHVTSLPTIPPTLNDGTVIDFGRFTGNTVPVGFGVTVPLTAWTDLDGQEQHPANSELTKSKKSILPCTARWNPWKFRMNQAVKVEMWGGSPPPLIRRDRTSGKPKKAAIA